MANLILDESPVSASVRRAGGGGERGRGVPGSPSGDRPRERLARLGGRALSDAEVIALLLRTGDRSRDAQTLSRAVLEAFGGLEGLVGAARPAIEAVPGLGPAKAASLLAGIELANRLREKEVVLGQSIASPRDVQRHFLPRWTTAPRESFHVLLLDGRHRLIEQEEVSIGTLTASLVHPREVFRNAIRCAAAALVLVHNHPSGDPSPSGEDHAVTERLRAAGELVGISVLDHVIVAAAGYYSFREAGHLERHGRAAPPDDHLKEDGPGVGT